MGVTRSFAGPLRISDLLAIEAAEGRVPSTKELIDIAINWSSPMLLTKPEYLSFLEKVGETLWTKGNWSPASIRDWLSIWRTFVPQKLYKPVAAISFAEESPKVVGNGWRICLLRNN